MNRTELGYDSDSPSPVGSWRHAVVTYTETNELLVDGIKAMIAKSADDHWIYLAGHPELTVHKCWSGYSEYTVTSQWDEIAVAWDGHAFYFEHLSEFFKALDDGVAWQRNY